MSDVETSGSIDVRDRRPELLEKAAAKLAPLALTPSVDPQPKQIALISSCLRICCLFVSDLHDQRAKTVGKKVNPLSVKRADVRSQLGEVQLQVSKLLHLLREPAVRHALGATAQRPIELWRLGTPESHLLEDLSSWAEDAKSRISAKGGPDNYIEASTMSAVQGTALCLAVVLPALRIRFRGTDESDSQLGTTSKELRSLLPGSNNPDVHTLADLLLEAATGLTQEEGSGRDWPSALREVKASNREAEKLPWSQMFAAKTSLEDAIWETCRLNVAEATTV